MEGTTAVVTGASRGIGASVARLFASEGAHVVCCARDEDALNSVVEGIREDGGSATAVRADVRDEFDVERLMVTAAREGQGTGVDVVVANAGVYHGDPGHSPLAADPYSAFDDHVRTNGRGVFTTVVEALPHLADGARILVPSGSIARDPKAGFGSYAVSKALAEAVVGQFAVELDVPTCVVDPGQVSTDLTGDGPGRDPEDVAGLFHWAATDVSSDDLNGAIVTLKDWKGATR